MADSPAQAAPRKVVVIGLDGATPEFVYPWIQEGRLPNLARLAARGARGAYRSTMPPFTQMAWPVFFTGCNPGKTGIFTYFDDMESPTRLPATGAALRAAPIWRRIAEQGRRSILVAVPVTYPPEPLEGGVVVAGMDAPSESSAFTHPPELREELLRRDYRIFVDRKLLYSGDTEAIWHEALRVSRVKTEVFTDLLRERPWDFAMIVLNEVDVVSHFMTGDRVRAFYEESDRLVGQILDVLDEDTLVLVISDHGVKPLKGRVYVNEILRELGLLTLKPEAKSGSALARVGINRDRVRGWVNRLGIGAWLKRTLPGVWEMRSTLAPAQPAERRLMDVDFTKTKLYLESGYWLRRPPGTPEPTEAELDALRAALAEIGGTLHRGADLYHGRHAHRAPEWLVYVPDHVPAGAIGGGKRVGPTGIRPGDHSMMATGILAGPEGVVRRGEAGGTLLDWAPTLMYLMGLSVPADMDGEVITDAVAPELLAARPPERGADGGGRDDLRRRIRRLRANQRV